MGHDHGGHEKQYTENGLSLAVQFGEESQPTPPGGLKKMVEFL